MKAAENQIINIGGDESLSVLDLAKAISEVFEVPLDIEWLPVRKEVAHAHCHHEKAKDIFFEIYENTISIPEGLKIMANDVRSKPLPNVTECPSEIEIFEQLPPSWASRLIK